MKNILLPAAALTLLLAPCRAPAQSGSDTDVFPTPRPGVTSAPATLPPVNPAAPAKLVPATPSPTAIGEGSLGQPPPAPEPLTATTTPAPATAPAPSAAPHLTPAPVSSAPPVSSIVGPPARKPAPRVAAAVPAAPARTPYAPVASDRMVVEASSGRVFLNTYFTAREALKVVSDYSGPSTLQRILSMEGDQGQTQPRIWKIRVEDPRTRSGIREMKVGDGRVYYDREVFALVRDSDAPRRVISSASLAVDSDEAFDIAQREAEWIRVGFAYARYRLEPVGNVPQWTLSLHDSGGGKIGEMVISTATGAILKSQWDRSRMTMPATRPGEGRSSGAAPTPLGSF